MNLRLRLKTFLLFLLVGNVVGFDNNVRPILRSGNDVIPRRVIRTDANRGSSNNVEGSNISLIVESVDAECKKDNGDYCKDQIQFNSLCIARGCRQWKTALEYGCASLCTGEEDSYRESYACQVGCSRAVDDYYIKALAALSPLQPPTLLSNSLKSTSLRLGWEGEGPARLPLLPFTAFSVQKRELNSLWETLSFSPTNLTQADVINLKPYTQYEFRVGLILSSEHLPFYSRESIPIQTLPQGRPSAPTVTSIQAISNTSVAVTWTPPSQPNGRLIAYILNLVPSQGNAVIKEIPVSQNPRGYTFSGLVPRTNYSLSVSAQNWEGEGDATHVTFVTEGHPSSPSETTDNPRNQPGPTPMLLIQGNKELYLQPLDLLMDPEQPFYTSSFNITAVAVHFKKAYVFLATTEGELRKIYMKGTNRNKNASQVIVSRDRLDLGVSHLSVDWLHDKVYIVGKRKGRSATNWIVKRCELDGSALTTIYAKLPAAPGDFAADPFSGYLYWTSPPSISRGGLMKLDLNAENFPHSVSPQVLVEGNDFGPFHIDPQNYRILVTNNTRNTVLAVSLDGDITDIRITTPSPEFNKAVSITMFNSIFYWTTQNAVGTEEYNSASDIYYQSSFGVSSNLQPLGKLIVLHPDSQPTPIPMAAPREVQVLYSQTRARISWKAPQPISALGAGAWCDWRYELRVSDNRSYGNISTTEFTIEGLRPSTPYTFTLTAYTLAGRGPPSPQQRGKTLRHTPYNITLLWGALSGLYATDTLGEELQFLTASPSSAGAGPLPLPHRGNMKDAVGREGIKAIAWFDSVVFFALGNGSVFYYTSGRTDDFPGSKILPSKDSSQRGVTLLQGVTYAESLAFDHIGHRIYWSNPRQQTIYRCALDHSGNGSGSSCSGKEPLQLVTMAKEIAIDSYKGQLLWSTGHSIEMARMNGFGAGTLFQNGMFSGKQIMGMTLDTEQSRVFWITRSAAGSTVHRLQYNIRGAQLPIIVASYEDTGVTGPIRYFNDRLLFLQSPTEAVITDLYGQGKSSLKLTTVTNITMIFVKDQGSLKWPGGLPKQKVQVIPDSVPMWSVDIVGKWDDFVVQWNPVNNTNHGKVMYDVNIGGVVSRMTEHTNITITITNSSSSSPFTPYSEVTISITALTYWGSARPTICSRRVPAWKPSEPLNPRIYLLPPSPFPYQGVGNANVEMAELRWDAPQEENGIILGYIITCWKGGVRNSCGCEVDMASLSCLVKGLAEKERYHFEVQAYTSAGAGPSSSRILMDTNKKSPLPKLFLTSSKGMRILDIDRKEDHALNLGYTAPTTANYLGVEETIFWFNEGQDLMMAKISGPGFNKSRILSLPQEFEAGHLTVDWIGRRLFWAIESSSSSGSHNDEPKYGIMSLDLEEIKDGNASRARDSTKFVISSKTPIKSVAFNPFRSALYWTTSKPKGTISLYVADTVALRAGGGSPSSSNGSFPILSSRPFLTRHLEESESCNCSSLSLTENKICFDPSGLSSRMERALLFISHEVTWAANEDGCSCYPIANISGKSLDVRGLAGDSNHIYILGGNNGSVISFLKEGSSPVELIPSGVKEMKAFGHSSQPFPSKGCLVLDEIEPESPQRINHTSFSFDLMLPRGYSSNCTFQGLSLPTTQYTVYYGTVDDAPISKCTLSSPSHCKVIRTTNPRLHISGLAPYTMYTFFVTLTNHYAKLAGKEPLACTPVMMQTAPGAPMPPQLLNVQALTPTTVRVEWNKPLKLNGEKVWYQVNWRTGTSSDSAQWVSPESSGTYSTPETHALPHMYLLLKDLLPAAKYSVWVRAFSEKGDAFSDSRVRDVWTLPSPKNVTMRRATPHSLELEWTPPEDNSIIKHQIFYREGASAKWNALPMDTFTRPGKLYNISLTHLKPRTLYNLRLHCWYKEDPSEPFVYPIQGPFHFETKADRPSGPPLPPIARGIGKALYEVEWKDAEENGAIIDFYSLEAKLAYGSLAVIKGQNETNPQNLTISAISIVPMQPTTPRNLQGRRRRREVQIGERKSAAVVTMNRDWVEVYRGKETRWIIENLDTKAHYKFRVRAKNVFGWGPFSNESLVYSIAELTMVAESQSVGVIILIVISSLVIITLFGGSFILLYQRRLLHEKPVLGGERREVELATLRELPGGTSFIHQSNMLYTGGMTSDLLMDLDLAGVPKVNWEQIMVTKFLGSGAFGEVYEGVATILRGDEDPEVRVAIKTLRKGANTIEKQEFVQEAKLMAQFRHPHIIQLLGICVDTDPCYLLLELMGEGDLLSYLRSNRPKDRDQVQMTPDNQVTTTTLNLVDLLRMCVDVAKGCVYLEDLHFVHRDIAARNCLVSLIEGGVRVVKIGDFGLARDIYRNDYYRKDGEGLLPVRWMAPESLVDGIFTTQTDVWAFGVLLWEIMTLGQQPYPARSNVDVLNYVRGGGRLQKPPHCPHNLGILMLQCWEYVPENRPSFKDCLSTLDLILQGFEDNVALNPELFPPLHDIHFDPYSYSEGSGHHYNSNQRGQNYPRTYSHHRREDSSDSVFHSGQPLSYLQVLNEEDLREEQAMRRGIISSVSDDGYEVPLPKLPPRTKNFPPFNHPSHPHPSTAEIGLPSPTSYYNAETLPLYRNLLASTSTSEGADIEDNRGGQDKPDDYEDVEEHSCRIRGHHYFRNLGGGGNHHLMGVSCHHNHNHGNASGGQRDGHGLGPLPSITMFNNRVYLSHGGRFNEGSGNSEHDEQL